MFDLKKRENLGDFRGAMVNLIRHLRTHDLVESIGPLCERSPQTPMDTDDERPNSYYFVTTFRSQKQCDDAYAYINHRGSEAAEIHTVMMSKVSKGAVFSCWAELAVPWD